MPQKPDLITFSTLSSTKHHIKRCVGQWSFEGFITRARFQTWSEAHRVHDLILAAYERGKSEGRAEIATQVLDAMDYAISNRYTRIPGRKAKT